MNSEKVEFGYGYCKNCGKYGYLSDQLCYECWIDEKAARNREYLLKRGAKHA